MPLPLQPAYASSLSSRGGLAVAWPSLVRWDRRYDDARRRGRQRRPVGTNGRSGALSGGVDRRGAPIKISRRTHGEQAGKWYCRAGLWYGVRVIGNSHHDLCPAECCAASQPATWAEASSARAVAHGRLARQESRGLFANAFPVRAHTWKEDSQARLAGTWAVARVEVRLFAGSDPRGGLWATYGSDETRGRRKR